MLHCSKNVISSFIHNAYCVGHILFCTYVYGRLLTEYSHIHTFAVELPLSETYWRRLLLK